MGRLVSLPSRPGGKGQFPSVGKDNYADDIGKEVEIGEGLMTIIG